MVIVMTYSNQSRKLTARAQRQIERSREVTRDFLIAELELSRTFAQIALDSFAAGNRKRANRAAAAAQEAFDTVRKFIGKVKDEEREPIESKLATLDPLIGLTSPWLSRSLELNEGISTANRTSGGCFSLGIGWAQRTRNCQPPAAGVPAPQGGYCFTGSFHDLGRGIPHTSLFRSLHGIDSRFGCGKPCSIALRWKLALPYESDGEDYDKQEKTDYRLGTPSRCSL